jgi:hypothetical protein
VTVGLYTRFRVLWQDGSAGGTPITAAALNYIEDGIVAASDHGQLAGLADDDHPHYLLRTDASAAYLAKTQNLTDLPDKPAARTNLDVAQRPGFAADEAVIGGSETTTSTLFTDLATIGPERTFIGPPSGRIAVVVDTELANDTAGQNSYASYELFNNTSASAAARPTDSRSVMVAGSRMRGSHVTFLNVTPGNSYRLRGKYRVTGGTGSFVNRRIAVVPILT